MATSITSIKCNNKSARDDDDGQESQRRNDSFGFAGGGCHTTALTLDGRNTQSQLVISSQNNHLQHQVDKPTLVDMLIDSQCDWRQLIGDANGPHGKLSQHLSETQIKRQEIIHELIQTERHHCLTLALMRQVYLAGLLRLNELRQRNNNNQTGGGGSSGAGSCAVLEQLAAGSLPSQRPLGEPIDIERLFPALEELIQAHELFFAHLRLRLVECCQSASRQNQPLAGIIGPLGDLLIEQFKLSHENMNTSTNNNNNNNNNNTRNHIKRHKLKCQVQSMSNNDNKTQQQSRGANSTNTNGSKLLQAYAKFCGQHYESSRYYKQLLQFDKGFKQFIEQCNKQHAACRQRGIPECNLLVAQRLTKYPLLIEQLIKASKDEPNEEEEKLRRALGECRALLAELNSQLARKESFERLLDIYAQFSPKSHTIFYHKSALRFTKHDLLQHKRLRQLLHSDDQVRIWSATRRKLFPVLCLILNDIIVFLRVDQQQQEQQISSSQQVAAVSRLAHLDQVVATGRDDSYDGHHEMATATTVAQTHQHALTTVSNVTSTTTSYLHQPPAPSLAHPHNAAPPVRYYFANVDNKSSVISLSKLLVREKAVEETEPRVYLISSSPKQPEMYELAFISRRHQTTFIDKLKTAIGAHNRLKLLSASRLDVAFNLLAASNQGLDSTTGSCGGYLEPAISGGSASECCSLTSCSSSSASSSLDGALAGPGGSECQPSDEDDGDYDEEDCEHRTGGASGGGGGGGGGGGEFSKTSQHVSSTTAASSHPPQVDLENLQLDIEQDLVPAPSYIDLTSSCCDGDGDGEDSKNVPLQLRAESATPSSVQAPGEIGLSERARDSCDDLSSPRLWLGQGCRRQKSRGNRKRRFQRPRQVSNQSTDSGATSGTSLTSGIGLGDCMEYGAASHGGVQSAPSAECAAKEMASEPDSICERRNLTATNDQEEEDLDSGRGRDDCSCSSSSSSTSSSPSLAASTCHDSMTTPGGGGGGGGGGGAVGKQHTETSELAAGGAQSTRTTAGEPTGAPQVSSTQTGVATAGQQHQQQQLGHKQHLLKQRKLSTVSTISSQMKLLQKLRSVGLLATAGCGASPEVQLSSSGANHHHHQTGPLSLCANCNYQQHQQQQQQHDTLLDDTSRGSMSKRHLEHLRQMSKRRSLFVPEQKLEELRNLRIQLDKDKQEWQEKFDRMQEQLLNERRELDLARERLKLDRTQIENEREQLYRKLEILKENGILLSPSHRVIITSPADQCARLTSSSGPNQQQQHQHQHQHQYHHKVNQNQQHFHHRASERHNQQHPLVYISQVQQQQQVGYGQQHPTVMMQQHQQQHMMASARVPAHLSQKQTTSGQQQHHCTSIRSPSGFMSVLPGASFLVRRFGGGACGAQHQPPVTSQPINGKLSQSTMTISHLHQQRQQQQDHHLTNQPNHVLL